MRQSPTETQFIITKETKTIVSNGENYGSCKYRIAPT